MANNVEKPDPKWPTNPNVQPFQQDVGESSNRNNDGNTMPKRDDGAEREDAGMRRQEVPAGVPGEEANTPRQRLSPNEVHNRSRRVAIQNDGLAPVGGPSSRSPTFYTPRREAEPGGETSGKRPSVRVEKVAPDGLATNGDGNDGAAISQTTPLENESDKDAGDFAPPRADGNRQPPDAPRRETGDTTVQLAVFQEQEMAELLRVLGEAAAGNFHVRMQTPTPGPLQLPGYVTHVSFLLNRLLQEVEERLDIAVAAVPLEVDGQAAPAPVANTTATETALRIRAESLAEAATDAIGEANSQLARAEQAGGEAVSAAVAQQATLETLLRQAQTLETQIGRMQVAVTANAASALIASPTNSSTHGEGVETLVQTLGQLVAQSDVLAFNAAIESARTGESGRGFGVLAGAMRKLHADLQAVAQSARALREAASSQTLPSPTSAATMDIVPIGNEAALSAAQETAAETVRQLEEARTNAERAHAQGEEMMEWLRGGRNSLLSLLLTQASLTEPGFPAKPAPRLNQPSPSSSASSVFEPNVTTNFPSDGEAAQATRTNSAPTPRAV